MPLHKTHFFFLIYGRRLALPIFTSSFPQNLYSFCLHPPISEPTITLTLFFPFGSNHPRPFFPFPWSYPFFPLPLFLLFYLLPLDDFPFVFLFLSFSLPSDFAPAVYLCFPTQKPFEQSGGGMLVFCFFLFFGISAPWMCPCFILLFFRRFFREYFPLVDFPSFR